MILMFSMGKHLVSTVALTLFSLLKTALTDYISISVLKYIAMGATNQPNYNIRIFKVGYSFLYI